MLAFKSLTAAGFNEEVIKDVGAWVDDDKEVIQSLQLQVEEQNQKIDDLVKGLKHLNPQVDKEEAVINRLTVQKAIVRAADKMLEAKPKGSDAILLKVIKRSGDRLINDSKQELKLNGKN